MEITKETFGQTTMKPLEIFWIVDIGGDHNILRMPGRQEVYAVCCDNGEWKMCQSKEEVLFLLTSGITTKDDRIKEAISEIHGTSASGEEKMKAINLLAEALRL